MSNDRLKRTIEFDLMDAPMLVHAMMIAANTAKMCGHRDAEKKLRAYQAVLKTFVPPEAAHFDEEAWAELGMALMEAQHFHVTVTQKSWEHHKWWSEGHLTVICQGRAYKANRGSDCYVKRGDDTAPQALYKVLKELAPMDCAGSWDNGKDEEEKW